jgi:hypothetical protein
MRKRSSLILAAALALVVTSGRVVAGPVITPGPVNVSIQDDPAGASFDGTVTPVLGSPVTFDNGRLTLTETIVPVNSTTAWAVFDINATGALPLAGSGSSHFNITISGIQTAPAALTQFFTGFTVNGTPDPFPFPGFPIGPNPITGTGSVSNGTIDPVNYSFQTSQQLYADIDPFDQGPANFNDSPANTPTEMIIGGKYVLQSAVPEPSGLMLAGLAAGWALRAWRRRSVK